MSDLCCGEQKCVGPSQNSCQNWKCSGSKTGTSATACESTQSSSDSGSSAYFALIIGGVLVLLVVMLVIFLYRRQRRPNFGREPLLGSQETERTSSRVSAVEMFSSMWNNPEKQTIGQAWEIDAAKLHINQKIGSGAFGAVFEGRYERTKQPVAIKRLTLAIDIEIQEQQVKEIHNEMTILWGLRHPHLLDFFGVAFMKKDHEEFMCLVTELCVCSLELYVGSAKKRLDAISKGLLEPMDVEVLRHILIQVATGLAFMHRKLVVHRDLKPANIFRDANGNYKIGDFGLSRILNDTTTSTTYTANIGSPAYMAPELLALDTRGTQYASPVDMYSFGVIIHALW